MFVSHLIAPPAFTYKLSLSTVWPAYKVINVIVPLFYSLWFIVPLNNRTTCLLCTPGTNVVDDLYLLIQGQLCTIQSTYLSVTIISVYKIFTIRDFTIVSCDTYQVLLEFSIPYMF